MGKDAQFGVACLSMLCVLAATGCAGHNNTTDETVALPKVPYTIKLKAAADGPDRVVVRGRTNLPDGSVVLLTAGQAHRYSIESEVHQSWVASPEDAVVKNGVFSAKLGPFYYRLLTIALDHLDWGPMTELDNAVTVCASFLTGKDLDDDERQPNAGVREAVGPNGERLGNSPQTEVYGELTDDPSNALEVVTRAKIDTRDAVAAVVEKQGHAPNVTRLAGFCQS